MIGSHDAQYFADSRIKNTIDSQFLGFAKLSLFWFVRSQIFPTVASVLKCSSKKHAKFRKPEKPRTSGSGATWEVRSFTWACDMITHVRLLIGWEQAKKELAANYRAS